MILGGALLAFSVTASIQVASPPPRSACLEAYAADRGAAAAEICLGEEAARTSGNVRDDAARTRQLEAAAGHFKKAVALSANADTKARALDALADCYDEQRLNDPKEMELALRELMRLTPTDLAPAFRLARVLEKEGLLEAAEDTLLGARRQQPDAADAYKMLAQFYVRRVTALTAADTRNAARPAAAPGERDGNGVYRVGGSITPPSRLGVPRYPADAQAAGISGVVIAEIVIDPSGNVAEAKVLRSVPLLDEAALQAVREWHYTPTVVNGTPTPVRMTVTVNFSQTPSAAASTITPSPAR